MPVVSWLWSMSRRVIHNVVVLDTHPESLTSTVEVSLIVGRRSSAITRDQRRSVYRYTFRKSSLIQICVIPPGRLVASRWEEFCYGFVTFPTREGFCYVQL